jgi:two-component system, NtrC family, nitrogen regulation response regulator NtrX
MADTLMMPGARTARFARPATALELAGHSPAITRVQELVRRAASLDVGVLLTAERGADVDSVARELHERSGRATAPFIVVECDGGDAPRVAQLLFGTIASGSSGSSSSTDLEPIARDSRLTAATGGTLFLHDVTELPAAIQARLARIARDGEVLIDGEPAATDVRFIASASPAVDADVHAHRLRSDLFRRLAAVRIDLPPLRDRQEDVAVIAARVLEEALSHRGLKPRAFTQAALALIAAVTWPGNLGELQAAITRVAADPGDRDIQVEHVLPALQLQRAPARFVPTGNLREARLRFERDYISAVLQHHAWRMADAARTLGIQRPNLYRKARQLGIPVTRMSE